MRSHITDLIDRFHSLVPTADNMFPLSEGILEEKKMTKKEWMKY